MRRGMFETNCHGGFLFVEVQRDFRGGVREKLPEFMALSVTTEIKKARSQGEIEGCERSFSHNGEI